MRLLVRSLSLLAFFLLVGSCLAHAVSDDLDISTATGNSIEYDNVSGFAVIEGSATVVTSTATLKADKITINIPRKEGHLEGHVVVDQTSGTIRGTEVFYNWGASTGVIYNAMAESPPFYFNAQKMTQVSQNRFRLNQGEFTSCDGDPPHYRIRSTKGKVHTGDRATMVNSRFILDETGAFWTPIYTRSLKPKKHQLRVEPGSSARDGFTNKTVFGYPFTPNTYTKLRWDYLQYTGNGFGLEHQYHNPNVRGQFDGYYIHDKNSDPQPESKRYDVNWNHYQKFTDRLTANAKFNFKSDQSVGNEFLGSGSQGRVENNTRGILSEAGLTYQFSKASVNAQLRRQDKFDSTVSSGSFISELVLPSLNFQTIPMLFKYFPLYTNFSGSYVNQTQNRTNPNEELHYQKSGNLGAQVKKDLRLYKVWTLTPRVGYTEHWQDRDLSNPESQSDWYQGRANTGLDLRRRFFQTTDLTLSENYVVRLARNQMKLDETANDRGVELNKLSASVVTRVGRDNRVSLASGYDFRQAPRNEPTKYTYVQERITSPSLDVEYHFHPLIVGTFRETYSLFDPSTKKPRATPLNTSGDIQFGELGKTAFFSQGFTFTKPSSGQDSLLYLNNKFRFYATPKWFIDAYLAYQLIGDGGLHYTRAHPVEKTLRVVRDLHCWVFRMEFSSRTGRHEASFYIDLKTNMNPTKNVFRSQPYGAVFVDNVDVSNVFPSEQPKDPQ